MTIFTLTVVFLSLTAGTVPATQATSAPSSQVVIDKAIEPILDRLEKSRESITTMQADIKHQLFNSIAEDKQIKFGFIRYAEGKGDTPTKFMVHFFKLVHDDLTLKRREWYCFDGLWLREIRDQTKTVIDRQVLKPGEKIDIFELGRGPFPLPLGQKKEMMVRNFEITLVKPIKNDPADTDHLKLMPRKDSRLVKDYKWIELWVDRKQNLPTKIMAEDRQANISTVWFTKIKLNPKIKQDELFVPKPRGYGYERYPLAD